MDEYGPEKQFIALSENIKSLLLGELGKEFTDKGSERFLDAVRAMMSGDEAFKKYEQEFDTELLDNQERIDILLKQLFNLSPEKARAFVLEQLNNPLVSLGTKDLIKNNLNSGNYI